MAAPNATGEIEIGRVASLAPASQSPKVAFLTTATPGGRPPGLPPFLLAGGVTGGLVLFGAGTVFGSIRCCLGDATHGSLLKGERRDAQSVGLT